MSLKSLEQMFKKKPLLFLVVLTMVVFALFPYMHIPSLTVFSVSQVNIDPQGYEDPNTHEWTGSFWIIAMTTDMSDQVAGIKLANPIGEPGNTYVEDSLGNKVYSTDTNQNGDLVIPESSVEIRIDPEQPYYERSLEISSTTIYPQTYGMWRNKIAGQANKWTDAGIPIEAEGASYRVFGTADWVCHTPFKVTILKNGVQIGEATIDTIGGTEVVRIPESGDEYIHLTNLGQLQGGYSPPTWDEVMFFDVDHIYQKTTTSINYVSYDGGGTYQTVNNWAEDMVTGTEAYSTYWFGISRWNDDHSPQAWKQEADTWTFFDTGNVGGWIRDDTSTDFRAYPVAPVVFSGDKSSLPPSSQGFYSLLEYLDFKNVPKVTMPSWLDHMEITSDWKMRLYMSHGAVKSLVTLKISTELADTIVWQPLVANFDITDFPDLGDIADRKTSTIKVLCVEGEGSGTITFTKDPSDLPVSIDPPTIGTGSMSAGDLKTWSYEIINLGTEEEIPFTLTATIKNSLGTTTDADTATGKLLIKTGSETVLTVKTVYQKDKQPISGITITIEYAEQSKAGLTDSNGLGSISFSLGSYDGNVKITSASTATYKPKELTLYVTSGQPNVVTLELYKYGEAEFDWMQYLPWILLGGTVITAISVTAYMKKKRKGGIR